MERIVNLLRGCVRIEAKAAFPAKILNLMAGAGVEFWAAEPVDIFVLRFSVRSGDLAYVERLAAQAGCSIKVLGRKGATVIKSRLRRRKVLLACLAICLMALFASSLFVWNIEVKGNETVTDGEILRALDDCGVSIGSFWPSFSSDLIRNEMLLTIPELRWMTVNVSNSKAEVIVRERIPKPMIVNNDEPVSVTAKKTGIITKMSVLQGIPVVKVGDAVLKGETLVTGVMESPYSEVRYVHALAGVEAAVWYELNAEAELNEYVKDYTDGTKNRWALMLGEKRINFYPTSSNMYMCCDKIIAEYPFSLEGIFTLPLTLIRESFTAYELTETVRNEDVLRKSLEATLYSALEQELDGKGEIVSVSYTSTKQNRIMIVTLRAECREDIAVETLFVP